MRKPLIACVVVLSLVVLGWFALYFDPIPSPLAGSEGRFETKYRQYNVDFTQTMQSTGWSLKETTFDEALKVVKENCPKSDWRWLELTDGKSLYIERKDGSQSLHISAESLGLGSGLSVRHRVAATRLGYWRDFIRSGGNVRVSDPFGFGLFDPPAQRIARSSRKP